jgi:hypothetical protein
MKLLIILNMLIFSSISLGSETDGLVSTIICYNTQDYKSPEEPMRGVYLFQQLEGSGAAYVVNRREPLQRTGHNHFQLKRYPDLEINSFQNWTNPSAEDLIDMMEAINEQDTSYVSDISLNRSDFQFTSLEGAEPTPTQLSSSHYHQLEYSFLMGHGHFSPEPSPNSSISLYIHCYPPFTTPAPANEEDAETDWDYSDEGQPVYTKG